MLQTIRRILEKNEEQWAHAWLWLVDEYETIPDFDFLPASEVPEGTESDEVDEDWRSPFIGTGSLHDPCGSQVISSLSGLLF